MPVFTLVLGAGLTFFAGMIRDRYQRVEDRKDNRSKLLRDELVELQFAVDEFYQDLYRGLLTTNDPVRAQLWGLKLGEGMPWIERFEASDRKLRVLASHVADAELQTRVDRFRTLAGRAIMKSYTPDELDEAQKPLQLALAEIHEYGGKRYQALI
jgi:hypothetical protein